MASYEITGVTRSGAARTGEVVQISNGVWRLPVADAMLMIQAGSHEFYILESAAVPLGQDTRIWLTAIPSKTPAGHILPALRSMYRGKLTDHLDRLPECAAHLPSVRMLARPRSQAS